MDQIVFVDMGQGGQLVQRQVFLKMVVNVPPDQVALPAAPAVGVGGGQDQIVPAQQPQQDHFQQMLADVLMPWLAAPYLLQHQPQAAGDLIPAGVKMGLDIAAGAGQHLQTVHPQHDILHGTARLAQLGVGDPSVDDHQIPAADGELPVLELEAALSTNDKK